MAVNKEFLLTWTVAFFTGFKPLVKFLGGGNVNVVNGTFAVEPLSSVQSARFQLLYKHCRGENISLKADIVLFAAFEAA